MPLRPNMQARNSSGKQVSLLNDDSVSIQESRPAFGTAQYAAHTSMARSNSNKSGVSTASSPSTPGLLRSHSYDSQTTNDPVSPITPVFMTDYERQSTYTSGGFFKAMAPQYEERTYEYPPPYPSQQYSMPVQPAFPDNRTSSFADSQYEEDLYNCERGAKRYPCRYRDSHHCEKTFTTSGHASRHSKIHTAEKAVHCSYQGCQKKFTRADNMKQHLETHYKSRNGTTLKSSSKSALMTPSGISKSAAPSRSSQPPSRNVGQAEHSHDPALYAGSSTERYSRSTHSASPTALHGTFDMGNLNLHSALMSRPMAAGTESSSAGLDVLANIAALQS
jgi:hypothetical protein